jgi:hypothetical protein
MQVPKPTKAPEIKRTSVKAWEKGTVTALDDGRTPVDGLRSSGNVILDQDGTIRPRGSLTLYGPQPADGWAIKGEVYEFTRLEDGIRISYMICMQSNGTVAHPYYATGDDTSWTEAKDSAPASVNYDPDAKAHFKQVADKILVMNGVNELSIIDTTNFEITVFDELTDPAGAPTATLSTSLGTGSSFKIYFGYTASSDYRGNRSVASPHKIYY